jgi:uncharacterized protein (DUF983 family)
MPSDLAPTPKRKGVCPQCGCNNWWNAWGAGNAKCVECGLTFNVAMVGGRPVGTFCEGRRPTDQTEGK